MIRKHCNFKTTFVKLCKSKNKRSTVNTVNDSVRIENCTYVPPEFSCVKDQETVGVINALNESGQSDNDDCFVFRL